ncbi:hypothetical protein C4K23_3740 [Pseudomonas chlororaphis]|nr:hypothetical protein C4K23_3740 [Pseudomonas chlororaphis]
MEGPCCGKTKFNQKRRLIAINNRLINKIYQAKKHLK